MPILYYPTDRETPNAREDESKDLWLRWLTMTDEEHARWESYLDQS